MLRLLFVTSLSVGMAILPACGQSPELEKPLKSRLVKEIPSIFRVAEVEVIVLDEPRDNVRIVRWEAKLKSLATAYVTMFGFEAFDKTLKPKLQPIIMAIKADPRRKVLYKSVFMNEAQSLYGNLSNYPWGKKGSPRVLVPSIEEGKSVILVGKAKLAKGKEWKMIDISFESKLPKGYPKDHFGSNAFVYGSPDMKTYEEATVKQYENWTLQWEALNQQLAGTYTSGVAQLKKVFAPGSQWEITVAAGKSHGESRAIVRFEGYDEKKVALTVFDPSFPARSARFEGEIFGPDKPGEMPWIEVRQIDVSPETSRDIRERVKRVGGPKWSKWSFSRGMRHGTETIMVILKGEAIEFRTRKNRVRAVKRLP